MSEFSIQLDQLKARCNQLDEIKNVLVQCKGQVANVNQGLAVIGIGEVGASLDAIVNRLVKHANKSESLSNALGQIIRRFIQAENNIMGRTVLFQMFDEMIQIAADAYAPIEESPYIGAIYLIDADGAGSQGHAAIVLLREDGTYEYFSFVNGDSGIFGNAAIDPADLSGDSDYTNFVFIPITDEQGDRMMAKIDEYKADPGKYNLFNRNCNIAVQNVLMAGDESLAIGLNDFDWMATRPNTVYQNFLDLVRQHPENYPGYEFGDIKDEDLAAWLNNDAQHFLPDGGHDYSVANTSNVHFEDPYGWLSNGWSFAFGGTSIDQISEYWGNGWSNGFHNGMDFTIDHVQTVSTAGIDLVQEYSTSGIDWVQDNYITGPFSNFANAMIDGGQWVGNGIIDGAQWVGNGIIDGGQWLADGAADIWDAIF